MWIISEVMQCCRKKMDDKEMTGILELLIS